MHEWMLILHIIVFLTITPLVIIINRKLYYNIKNEEHRENGKVLQRILKTYSIVQCTLPVLCHLLVTPYLSAGILEKLEPMLRFCFVHLTKFLMQLYASYTSSNSLIIALCRYMFIVFEGKANRIGIQKLRYFFFGISGGLPLGLVILHNCVISLEEFKEIAVLFDFGNVSTSTNETIKGCVESMFYTMENPLYCLIKENFNSTLITMVRIIVISTSAILFSNLIEGFIYIHTFTYCIR